MAPRKIPVILDTDIGDDIDDTWALAMLLRCPELDLRLVTTCYGDTDHRADLVAKLLEVGGRTDVPIGIGKATAAPDKQIKPQAAWVRDFDRKKYSGEIHADGVAAMIDAIMASDAPVTLLAIGPLTNVGEALRREPRIVERVRFVGMLGCIRRHYRHPRVVCEYNVVCDIAGARAAMGAAWPKTITPIDTCGFVRLEGERYQRLLPSDDALIRAVMENYRCWEAVRKPPVSSRDASSVLFDTVAVYLAFAEDLLEMEELPLVVADDGVTRVDPGGQSVRCAMDWRDLDAYNDFLVDRLLGKALG